MARYFLDDDTIIDLTICVLDLIINELNELKLHSKFSYMHV